jgi:hypothetical protein
MDETIREGNVDEEGAMIQSQRCGRAIALAVWGHCLMVLCLGVLGLSPGRVDAGVVNDLGSAIEGLKTLQRLCDTAATGTVAVGAAAPGAVGVVAQLAYLQGLEGTLAKHLSAADEQLALATAELNSVKTTYAKLQEAEEAVRIIARDAEASKQPVRAALQALHSQAQTLDKDTTMKPEDRLAKKRDLATEFSTKQGELGAIDQQANAKAAPHLQEITDAHQKGVNAEKLRKVEKRQTKLAQSLPLVKAAGAKVSACLQGKMTQLTSAPASRRGDTGGDDTKDTRDFGAINQNIDKFQQGEGPAGPARGTGLGGGNATGQRNAQDSPGKPAGGFLPSPYGYSPYGYPAAGSRQDSVEVPHNQLPPFTNPGTSDKPAGMSGKPGKKSGCAC